MRTKLTNKELCAALAEIEAEQDAWAKAKREAREAGLREQAARLAAIRKIGKYLAKQERRRA